MSGLTTLLIEATTPLQPMVLVLAGALFLWLVGSAMQSRPRRARQPVSAVRLAGRRR